MKPARIALYLGIALLALILIVLALRADSTRERLPRMFRVIKQGLNNFDYLPSP